MKLWPKKKWKRVLLIFFLAVVVNLAILVSYAGLELNKDVVSGIDVLNPGGSKSVLVVYS